MANISISNRTSNKSLDLDSGLAWSDMADTAFQITFKPYFINHEVVISFVSAEEIRELNRLYRYKDSVTDVLSFNAIGNLSSDLDKFEDLDRGDDGEAEDSSLGDIVICFDQAVKQASAQNHSLEKELAFLFVHGLLHLLGYDHEAADEAEQMYSLQDRVLSEHGFIEGVLQLANE